MNLINEPVPWLFFLRSRSYCNIQSDSSSSCCEYKNPRRYQTNQDTDVMAWCTEGTSENRKKLPLSTHQSVFYFALMRLLVTRLGLRCPICTVKHNASDADSRLHRRWWLCEGPNKPLAG